MPDRVKRLGEPTDDDLARDLAASQSLMVGMCDGSRYAVMFSYHELITLGEIVAKRTVHKGKDRDVERVAFQIADALPHAASDHLRHEERGTCIDEPIPSNPRTRQRGGQRRHT